MNTMKMHFRIVGDVHGKTGDYVDAVADISCSLQLGDMGFYYKVLDELDPERHKFLPGNHDNYTMEYDDELTEAFGKVSDIATLDPTAPYTLRGNAIYKFTKLPPHFIGNYGVWYVPDIDPGVDNRIFFVRGAWSVDHKHRSPGLDWFEAEQLSQRELHGALDLYKQIKPEFVITHEAPSQIGKKLVPANSDWGPKVDSNTDLALQAMFEAHQPKLWVFGHYHHDYEEEVDRTTFICLAELSVLDFDKSLAML